MKTLGATFRTDMVQAIMQGRKTQTRRLIKDTGLYAIDPAIHGEVSANRERAALATQAPWPPGTILYVKETYADISGPEPRAIYKADGGDAVDEITKLKAWQSPRFMARKFARIWLRVDSVHVERIQDITPYDAEAEGIDCARCQCEVCCSTGVMCPASQSDFIQTFAHLWNSIHDEPGTRWEDSPWVFAYQFSKIEKPQQNADKLPKI